MRRFLREKDLKKHLKGKKSFGEEESSPQKDEKTEEDLKKKEILASLREDLEKDIQLKEAVSLLKGWSVMSKVFSYGQANNEIRLNFLKIFLSGRPGEQPGSSCGPYSFLIITIHP